MKPFLLSLFVLLGLTFTSVITATAQEGSCPLLIDKFVQDFKSTLSRCALDDYDDHIRSLTRHQVTPRPYDYDDSSSSDYGHGSDD